MNKFLLFALTFIFSFQLSAQSDKYVKMMEKQVSILDSARTKATLTKLSNINVVIAIGDTKIRRRIYNKLKKKNFFFPNIHSGNLNIELNKIQIGKGNIICSNSIVRPRVTFGNGFFLATPA